jgi:hypothetical protein
MAKKRELKCIAPGEYQATCFWREGKGIEDRFRYAENAGIKVEEKWAYIYLRDGEEIIKLSRTRNESAQVYVDKSLREAIAERVINGTRHQIRGESATEHTNVRTYATSAAWNENETVTVTDYWCNGDGCTTHTPAWFAAEIDSRIAALISDADWPNVLSQRKIDEANAEAALKQSAVDRAKAKADGCGEWRKDNGEWLVAADNQRVGDIIPVRRRDGSIANYELVAQVSPKLFKVGAEIPAAEVESRKTKKLLVMRVAY